jgi:hypothetical protein
MKEEVIPAARLGSCLWTMSGIIITAVVLISGLGGLYVFMALLMCLVLVISLGLRTLPGATYLKLNEQGLHLTDYYLPSKFGWSQIKKFELAKTEWKFGRPKLNSETLFLHVSRLGDSPRQKIAMPALKLPPRELLAKLTLYQQEMESRTPGQFPPSLPAQANTGIYRVLTVVGYICAVLALILCPPVFGIVGFTIGTLLARKGVFPHGNTIRFLSIILGVIGVFIGLAIVAWQETSAESQRKKQQWEESAPMREAFKKYMEEHGKK